MSNASDDAALARHVLHLNLNTADIQAAQQFYTELLGLDLRMQSEGDDGDWRFHGIDEPVSSAGWFLYDHRGPRESPAFELVEWRRPPTLGSSYETLVHRGLTSVSFRVSTLDGLAEKTIAAGGTVVGDLDGDALLIRDLDGVHVELRPDAVARKDARPQLATARIGCADLSTSLAWYAELGFAVTAEPGDTQVTVGPDVLQARSARIALPNPAVELELTQWLDPIATEPAEGRLWHRGMVRMAISVEDLDEAITILSAGGKTVPEPLFFPMPNTKLGGLRVLFLTDPDGFTVELVHRPSRLFSPGGTA
jgi:catechol 2,3-dioxygenase-like lactoylglutathione lyase family enzyme